jgi:HK97 family phage major capsid protein
MTDLERASLAESYQLRAQEEGATTHGGFAVPVFIDPSVILTDQESGNPILRLARTVNVNTNQWKGVSAAGVVWSFDAEGTAVSDDSITLAQPSVTVYTARGFVPYTIEVEQDWAGFSSEMARLMAAGYDELLADKFARGSGTGEPQGVITALDATATSEVLLTTNNLFGQEDVYKVWKALPEKYRSNAAWMMSVDVNSKIRQMGVNTQLHAQTVALPAGSADRLMDHSVYTSSYFPDYTSGTSAHQNVMVVGDWDNYVVARRAGMSIELVPHLLDVTSNRPLGMRGVFAWARCGGAVVNASAFRLLNST